MSLSVTEVATKLKAIVKSIANVDAVDGQTVLRGSGGVLDSLAFMVFLTEIETKLEYKFNIVELLDLPMDVFGSIDALARYICKDSYVITSGYAVTVETFKYKKLLILDCDGTLWRGTLAEGEKIEYYDDFQRRIKKLKENGIMLAICSHNNLEDIRKSLWPILLPEDFVFITGTWGNKGDAIKKMLENLNILAQHCVFVDDNPAERDIVNSMIPEIECPELIHGDYENIFQWFFDSAVTDEDKHRTQMYQEEADRQRSKKAAVDYDKWLDDIGLDVTYHQADVGTENHKRAVQLLDKANQFNCFPGNLDSSAIVFKAKDKFGDMGIVGAIRIEWGVCDRFVLSCRAFGRKIEYMMWNVAKSLGATMVKFKDTGKNKVAKAFINEISPHWGSDK